MKICALTMVYRDHWALSQWYMHYSSQLGAKSLFVIAHGHDDKIQNICPEANVITIPRDGLDRFDYVRAKIMNDFHSTLADEYDWTIRTDADELICLDPSHYSSFVELLSKRWGPAVFALGFELVEEQGQTPVPMDTCVFDERTAALFTGHYSKAWAFRQDARALRHGMEVGRKRAIRANFAMPEGVYLAHLKFADTAALEKANPHRKEVASSEGTGMPGTAWASPHVEDQRFFSRFRSFQSIPWETARNKAYRQLSVDPVRDPNSGIVRARSLRFEATTHLPEWFKPGELKT